MRGAHFLDLEQLTPRELERLALIAEGRTDRGIAKELFVTPKTVDLHVRSIFRQLELPADERYSPRSRRAHLPARRHAAVEVASAAAG